MQVFVNANGVTANAGPDVSICQGNSTTLTASGGGAGATYNWSTGQSGQNISVNPNTTTTYTVTVTNNGCTGTDQVTVTITPVPNANAGPDESICEGQQVTLTASGGTQNNQYLWNTGQTGATINVNPLNTTTYTVTVTINGCTDSDQVTVTVNDAPTVDAGSDVQICAGESTVLTANGSATTYNWSTGQSGSSIIVSPSSTTTYTVTATENGCTSTDNVTVTVGNINAGVTPDQSICEGSSVTLIATGGTTYVWSTGETGSSIMVSPSSTTTYSVTATQGICTDVVSVVITVNPIPVASISPDQEICMGESVTLTASGGTTYNWSSGQNSSTITVSPASTTNYTVTVTTNGCSSTASAEVLVHPSPNAFAGLDQNLCDGEFTTLTASGGQPGDEYEWSSGETTSSITIQPNATTTYSVTITNQWNCADVDNVTVTVNPIPVANAGPDVDLCSGNNVTLIATGGTNPSTYLWSTGQSGSTINVSPATTTTYSVTITVAGCSSEDAVEVTVLQSPVAFAGDDLETCESIPVQLTATGGGNYNWSNGQNTQTIQVTPASTTTYGVTVTSANGCTDTDNVTVAVNINPQANAGPDQSICEGETTSLTGSGGTIYNWSNGQNTQVISVSPASTTSYQLTVTDANGCSDTDIATVVINSVPVANAGPNVFIVGGGSATLIASGGGTYLWSTGETTNQITVSPNVTTTYTVTVTINGCSDYDDVTVFVNEAPTVDLGPDQIICQGETATLDATISGPFDLEFLWSTSETTSVINVSPSVTTSYSVTATDLITGFSSIDTINVTVLTLPIGNPVINGPFSLCQNSLATYAVDPVTAATLYTWALPSNASIISGQGTTSINVNWGTSTGGQVELIVSNSCGSLPAVFIDIIVNTEPLLIGPINGQLDPCADGSSSYSILPVANADEYQWTLTGGGSIVSGLGSSDITIDWNGVAGGDLCVIAVNECGNSQPVCITISTTETPSLSAGIDQTLCGLNSSLSGSGTGQWTLVSGPGTAQFSNANDPLSNVSVTSPGNYVFSYSFSQNGCAAEDQVSLTFNENPVIINQFSDCNDLNTAYTISFDIVEGQPSYLVNGNNIVGSNFSSGLIDTADAYSFVVTDANGCVSQEISGQVLCLCHSEAGTMDQTLLDACVDGTIIATFNGGHILDVNDVLAFALHDGNIPGGIIAWNTVPEFSFTPPMLPEITYYISAVVGESDVNGFPKISSPCLVVSQGTPVTFHDFPQISLSSDTAICEGGCAIIIVQSNGNGLIDIVYQDEDLLTAISGPPGINEITVCPGITSVYNFISITDQYCSLQLSEDVEVEVIAKVFAGDPIPQAVCEGDNVTIQLPDLISGGDPGGVWSETSAVPSSPGAFDPGNATFNTGNEQAGVYSFEYIIAGTGACSGSSAIVDISINELPLAITGEDEILGCDETSVPIDGNGSSAGAEIKYQWSTIGGVITGNANNLQVGAAKEGIYILEVRNELTGCKASDSTEVIAAKISIDELQIEATPPLCFEDCNASIEVLIPNGEYLYDFGNGTPSATNILNNICSGNHTIGIIDTFGCRLDTTISITDPPKVEVSLGPDQTIILGDSITLVAESEPNVILFNWSAHNCISCQEITVAPTESTIYSIEVSDINNCTATDEVVVTLEYGNKVFIPSIFSPNGDGVNDFFMIEGSADLEKINSLEIFDRWGNLIFQKKDIESGAANSWDGSYKGKQINPGVYVYAIEVKFKDGQSIEMIGDLTIIR